MQCRHVLDGRVCSVPALCGWQVCTLAGQPAVHVLPPKCNIRRGEHKFHTMPVPSRARRAGWRAMPCVFCRQIQIESRRLCCVPSWHKLQQRRKWHFSMQVQGWLLWLFRRSSLHGLLRPDLQEPSWPGKLFVVPVQFNRRTRQRGMHV